jgi:isopentenyl phosphate kinase
MLTFIKLGGSLITDKLKSGSFHPQIMQQTAQEIAQARRLQPEWRWLIGHGSGSFGHFAAQKYGTIHGVATPEQWQGFAEVGAIARKLNNLVVERLLEVGLPIFTLQPSASAYCENGHLIQLETAPILTALQHGLVPVVYGDVAIDSKMGGTIISTEKIFVYLAKQLKPDRIFLLGEVAGIYDRTGKIIEKITPNNFDAILPELGVSHGTDVTGGMVSKVQQMIQLVKELPDLEIRIFSGKIPGQLANSILGQATPGTLISHE